MNAINAFNRLCISFMFLYNLLQTIECINEYKCNFHEYQSYGCADKRGSQCDKKTQRCVCKPEFTIRLGGFCFQPKYMTEDCFTSAQCNHIPNAGCYNYREEFTLNPSAFFGTDQTMWPSGMCRCKVGHWFDTEVNTCVQRVVGSWCSNLWDCRHDDRAVVNTYVCENNECKCSQNHRYNQTTHECHYKETYGKSCVNGGKDECIHPTQCANSTCDCASNYHLDNEKTPKCQPNNNLNDIKSAGSLDVAKGDKTFEIFILTVIPIVIIFLTLKPCLKKFGKCKPQTDEVICGSKEISIKCSDLDKEALNQHKFCEKLQTIEEVVEENKPKEEDIVPEVDSNGVNEEKSIEKVSPKDNSVNETTISMEFSANS